MKEELKYKWSSGENKINLNNFLNKSLESHRNSENEEICLKLKTVNLFVGNKYLENNLRNQYASEYLSVQCEFCGKRYKNFVRLKDHFRFCHPKIFHKCSVCSQQFSKKWFLNTHMRKHTSESPYHCLYCNQKFKSNNKLKNHTNLHHKEKNFFCEICNAFGFYSKQDLGNHIRTKHTKERVFLCDICNKSFMSSGVYYQHRFIHTGIRKYSCTVCSKTFRRSLTLNNHLKIHTNERPYSCGVCQQTFRQKGDVKKHKINQHSNIKF